VANPLSNAPELGECALSKILPGDRNYEYPNLQTRFPQRFLTHSQMFKPSARQNFSKVADLLIRCIHFPQLRASKIAFLLAVGQ
jgi:hypothetical protein